MKDAFLISGLPLAGRKLTFDVGARRAGRSHGAGEPRSERRRTRHDEGIAILVAGRTGLRHITAVTGGEMIAGPFSVGITASFRTRVANSTRAA